MFRRYHRLVTIVSLLFSSFMSVRNGIAYIDLAITDAHVEPQRICTNPFYPVDITCTVSNLGDTDAPPFDVDVLAHLPSGSYSYGYASTRHFESGLLAGESSTIAFPIYRYRLDQPGDFEFETFVSTYVPDEDWRNDSATSVLQIRGTGPFYYYMPSNRPVVLSSLIDADLHNVDLVGAYTQTNWRAGVHRLRVGVAAHSIGSALEACIRVFDYRGIEIARSEAMGGEDPYLDVDVPDGCYWVGISGLPNTSYSLDTSRYVYYGEFPGSTGLYTLTIIDSVPDAGDNPGTAADLGSSSQWWSSSTSPYTSVTGLIGDSLLPIDQDIFRFSLADPGRATFQLYTLYGSPLAGLLELMDGTGRLLASATATTSWLTMSRNLPPGVYFASVRGAIPVSMGDYHLVIGEQLKAEFVDLTLDSVSSAGAHRTKLAPGDTLSVALLAHNYGGKRNVVTTLNVFDSSFDYSNISSSLIYDSHQCGQDRYDALDKNQRATYTYMLTLPTDARPGQYRIGAAIRVQPWGTVLDTTGPEPAAEDWSEAAFVPAFSVEVPQPLIVPYYSQSTTNWCAMASASMLLKFYGVEEKPWQIAADRLFGYKLNEGPCGSGNVLGPVRDYVNEKLPGASASLTELEASGSSDKFASIKNRVCYRLASGSPVILGSSKAKHVVVAVGYSDNGLYINDPGGALFQGETPSASKLLTWASLQDQIFRADGNEWVEMIEVESGLRPASLPPLTLSLSSFADEPIPWGCSFTWPFSARLYSGSSSIWFENHYGGGVHRLSHMFDGTGASGLGYRFVPTAESLGVWHESNPDGYYNADPLFGYSASLSDHLFVEALCANSGPDTDATSEVTLQALDAQGRPVGTPLAIGHSSFMIPSGTNAGRISVDWFPYSNNGQPARLASLLDHDLDGKVDNPSRLYRLTMTLGDGSRTADTLGVEFRVHDDDYAWLELTEWPESRTCAVGRCQYIPFRLRNNGRLDDTPQVTIKQLIPAMPALNFSVYEDEDLDGRPDGQPLSDSDADGRINMPMVRRCSVRSFLLRVDVPSTMPTGSTSEVSLRADSGTDSQERAQSSYARLSFVSPVAADLDQDSDVDLDDLALLEACVSGPAMQRSPIPVCRVADLDFDGDVDQSDFGIFQRCWSGADKPADPNCAK